jgi:uncharacterized protein (TIGR01244 family)
VSSNDRIQINERVVVGKVPPTLQVVEGLTREGFRSVVNLREEAEENQALSPQQEGEAVRRAGMEYLHIPVSSGAMDPALVDRFRREVSRLPGPVFVHCASGRRAGTFSVMLAAAEEGLSGDAALARAKELGFDWSSTPELEAFIRRYLDRSA